MVERSDGHVERRAALEPTLGSGERVDGARARVVSVYDDIGQLLVDRGWAQGRETSGRRLSLTAAIDVVAVASAPVGIAVGSRLGRTGRLRRHLCELAGAANLIAWNDDGERTIADVLDLLHFASLAYPDD